MQFGDTADI